MTNYEWQSRELGRYQREKERGRSSAKDIADFEERYKGDVQHLKEQLDWIVHGSYGAADMFKLQQVYLWCKRSKRANYKANLGMVFLSSLFMGTFRHWNKLSPEFQAEINQVVEEFFNSKDPIEWNVDLLPELQH